MKKIALKETRSNKNNKFTIKNKKDGGEQSCAAGITAGDKNEDW